MTLSDKAALDAQAMADALFAVIEHGDEKHRAWLKQELRDWFAALRAEPPADVAKLVAYHRGQHLRHPDADVIPFKKTADALTSLSRRNAELEQVAWSWLAYDQLLRAYAGPIGRLCAGDFELADKTYDDCVKSTEAALKGASDA